MEGWEPPIGVLGEDERVSVRKTRLVVGAALVLALSGGCTSDPSDQKPPPSQSAASKPRATPPPEPPERGSCYRLTYEEALAPTADRGSVDCAKTHSSQTYTVGRLATELNGHLLAVDSTAVQTQVARRCPVTLGAYLGATDEQLRLSMLRAVWFTPSVEDSDAGSNWFRCDVIALAGEDRLARVTGTLEGILAVAKSRAAYAMCGTAEPGTTGFQRVPCGEPHSWRAIRSVPLDPEQTDGSYPGEDVVREAGAEPCAAAAREIAEDALDYEWGYEWPTRQQWAAGQTYGRCWAPAS